MLHRSCLPNVNTINIQVLQISNDEIAQNRFRLFSFRADRIYYIL